MIVLFYFEKKSKLLNFNHLIFSGRLPLKSLLIVHALTSLPTMKIIN